MRASEGGPASRAQHMMDCCVRQREIEREKRGEGNGGKTRAFYRRQKKRKSGGEKGKCKGEDT